MKRVVKALTCVAQLVGHHPAKQKVMGLIPDQGTCLGLRFCPWSCAYKMPQINVSHIDVSLPLFLPPIPLSKNK